VARLQRSARLYYIIFALHKTLSTTKIITMKKVLLILFVAGSLAACSNNADSKTEEKKVTTDSNTTKPDPAKMNTDPAHGMTPHDTGSGRRPRD
jgi:hypothetical protein